jgi:hypothetical protein
LKQKKDNFWEWVIKDLADPVLKFISIYVLRRRAAVSGFSFSELIIPQVVRFGTMYLWNSTKADGSFEKLTHNTLIPEWV